MARSRLALGGAIAAVVVLALVGLVGLVVVGDGGDDQLASSAGATTTLAAVTVATTVPATSTTTLPVTTSVAPSPATASTAAAPAASSTIPADRELSTRAGAHGPVQAALTQARQRWLAARPAGGYVWSYEMACRCSPRKVEVTVDGGGAVAAVRGLDGVPTDLQPDAGLSVDGALAELQAAIDANVASITVRFDPTLGLPSSYAVDRSIRVADEERGLTVLAFTPRS